MENEWVRHCGFGAGLFFISRKKIDPRICEKHLADKATLNEWYTLVPSPFRKGES